MRVERHEGTVSFLRVDWEDSLLAHVEWQRLARFCEASKPEGANCLVEGSFAALKS